MEADGGRARRPMSVTQPVAVLQNPCRVPGVTHKSGRIAEMVAQFQGQELDARYLAYFNCFNREMFYEAHDVLEDLWLLDRKGPDGDFYKGLIQLAGAFVHLQKGRLQPCVALLRLARSNLGHFPSIHHGLDVMAVLHLTTEWEALVNGARSKPDAQQWSYPKLQSPA